MKWHWRIALIILSFGFLSFLALKARAANYDRNAAVTYADRYCRHENPAYYCPDWNDCMNFSSQVLYAGGLPEIGWWEWEVSHWFFNGCDWLQHSNTWSVPSWFDNHAEQTPSRYQQLGIYSLSAGMLFFLIGLGKSMIGSTLLFLWATTNEVSTIQINAESEYWRE